MTPTGNSNNEPMQQGSLNLNNQINRNNSSESSSSVHDTESMCLKRKCSEMTIREDDLCHNSSLSSVPAKSKRQRSSVSLRRSFRSLYSLADHETAKDITPPQSPAPSDATDDIVTITPTDSLIFQLGCIGGFPTEFHLTGSETFSEDNETPSILRTVISGTPSDSSNETILYPKSCLGNGATHSDETQLYGWFIDVDTYDPDGSRNMSSQASLRPTSGAPLRFQLATTIHNEEKLDAEVEWALAADTVDDVLGDFF